jgi:drug/metabolite transporter (DMT)-like permease
MKAQTKAYLYAGITILFWSTVATAFKIALAETGPAELLLISTCTSMLVLLLIGGFQGQMALLFKASREEYLRSALMGLINPFAYYLILFRAYSLLPAQVAQPLNMIWPIVLVFLSVPFLGHTVSKRSILALIVCFAGVYFISSQGKPGKFEFSSPLGIGLALSSSIIWAFYWILNIRDKRDEIQKLFMNFLFASFYIVLFMLLRRTPVNVNNKVLLAGIYIGIFEMGLSFVFWLKALRYTNTPDQVSILMYLFPFISLIFIHFILGEKIYLTTLLGLFLIVSGIIYQKLR